MVDMRSPHEPLTVHLPADLIAELQTLAREKRLSVDEVVCEACLGYTEPYAWERTFKQWRQTHPHEKQVEFGIDGEEIAPPGTPEGTA